MIMASAWASAQVYVVRLINRVLGRQWSFIIVGASGVGKTGLVEVLTNEEPNMTVSSLAKLAASALTW